MKTLFVWSFFLSILGLIIWAVDSSEFVQDCVTSAGNQNQQQPVKENISAFSIMFGWHKDCFGGFVREYDAAITAIATVLLSIVTAGLVLVGYQQITTTHAQLRAYVFVRECRMEVNAANEPVGVVLIQNTGQTPAYRLTVKTSSKTFIGQEIRSFVQRNIENLSKTDIGNMGIIRSEVPIKEFLTSEGVQAIKTGQMELYIWGVIRYRDTFKKRQKTEFRYMIGGPHGWPDDEKFFVCSQGNKAT